MNVIVRILLKALARNINTGGKSKSLSVDIERCKTLLHHYKRVINDGQALRNQMLLQCFT